MKNQLIYLQTLIKVCVIATFIISCSEEQVKINNEQILLNGKVDLKNGLLHFKDIQFYRYFIEEYPLNQKDEFIQTLDKVDDFNSYTKMYVNKKSNSSLKQFNGEEAELLDINEFFGSLINEFGLIGIGEFTFKINPSKNEVLVIEESDLTLIEKLKTGDISDNRIMVFSTDDDVIDLLLEGVRGTKNSRLELFCSESGASSKKDDGSEYHPATWGWDYRQDNKVVYQKAGIYFSLQAKIKTQRQVSGVWWAYTYSYLGIDFYYKYKAKCKSEKEGWDVIYSAQRENEFNKRIYESTTALHKYNYRVRFYGLDFWSGVYEIKDGY